MKEKDSLQNDKEAMQISESQMWLETIESEKVKSWVAERNQKTAQRWSQSSLQKNLEALALQILNSEERIPQVSIRGDWVYNFWTDKKNPRGVYRRALYKDFVKHQPRWEVLLDIDELNKKEQKSWVYRGCSYLNPSSKTCLLFLSDSGKDAYELREFDPEKKVYISEKSFFLPVGKHQVAWFSADEILVSSSIDQELVSPSGYGLRVRLWKRGTDFFSAPIIFEGQSSDMMVWVSANCRPEGCDPVLGRMIDFYRIELWQITKDKKTVRLPVPEKVSFQGAFKNDFYVSLNQDYSMKGVNFQSGDLLKVPMNSSEPLQLAFRPHAKQSFQGVRFSKEDMYLSVLENVTPILIRGEKVFKMPGGNVLIDSIDAYSNRVLITEASPTQPLTLFELNDGKKRPIQELPPFFSAQDLLVEQLFVKSDNVEIPYFVIRKKGPIQVRPTIVNAYGGFQVPLYPGYEPVRGKLWLEGGGQFVIANIRGGGEFGPQWHQTALRENRERAFNDLFRVTEDLYSRGYAKPESTGFVGGSNGGLLAGVAMTRRPDLFKAIIIQVPLLDMWRFHKLLAGNSWMAEYGNPDVPADWEFIKKYSPLHQLKKGTPYPKVFLMTSTRDDRVHPGHARKFAARMEELGIPFEYYENWEGGHGAAADNIQRAHFVSQMYAFMREELGL